MEVIRHALLPRRLTQMYTDTKKSYEQIIQTSIINPQLASLHLKLRIQKDRLVAWGLEWADSNTDQMDDIDGSLDRAGISDLVASILSNIKELIDDTERIQSRPRQQLPGAYPDDKAGSILSPGSQWTPTNLARLEDIVKDITASIDTLCDLSRTQQILRQNAATGAREKQTPRYPSEKFSPNSSIPSNSNTREQKLALSELSTSMSKTRIDPVNLIYPTRPEVPAATPPSYNTTATDPGNRVYAFLKTPQKSSHGAHSYNGPEAIPVLVDYYMDDSTNPLSDPLPPSQRYEDLVLALQGSHERNDQRYTGSLKLVGWFADPSLSRYAFVYEVPHQSPTKLPMNFHTSFPSPNTTHSLLSYLQHSGETDTSNVPCLEDRLRLALNLVTNILHIHAKGLIHRNINSNNVVFVNESGAQDTQSKPWKEGIIRKPFLVSWDPSAADTFPSSPETLMSNIYRHPMIERGQRSHYRPAHDIYSLGLILLEIGLWMPLNKLWKTKYSRSGFKSRLQAIYAPKMSAKCGRAYMNAVDYCLRAVDEDESARAYDRATSRDRQAKVQNDYYWNVFKPLERCCMMDDCDEPRVVPASNTTVPRSDSEEAPSVSLEPEKPSDHLVEEPVDAREAEASEPAPYDKWTAFSPLLPGNKVETCIWHHNVPNEIRKYFDAIMAPKLNRLFTKAIDRLESYEIYVCMAGRTPDLAQPTILMVCKSLLKAWKILDYVNKEKEMFQLYVAPGQLTRSKGKKKRKAKAVKVEDKPGQQPSRYQQQPKCGASIGCFVDEQHSEAVTFGGVVLVDGEPHGMSVHHMLEDPSDSAVDTPYEEAEASDSMDPELMFADFPTDSDALDNVDVTKYDVEEFEQFDMGDFPGTDPGKGDHIIVTQPALDDVDPGYFSSEDNMSDDHLVIHGLGTIHASSGLRRFSFDNIAHEVDWALFKLHDDRKPVMNVIDGGIKHCEKASQPFHPCQVLKADALGDLQVHAFGSTSGLESGTILPTMQLTKMPGRVYASPVWRVKGKFGVGGDSGAWVIDNATGAVCAHVTAYSETMKYATIAPMEVLFHDMEQILGTSIALPDDEQAPFQTFKQQMLPPSGVCVGRERGGWCRIPSLDASDYGSGSEPETQSLHETTPSTSPVLATSPQPLRRMSTLSLDHVAGLDHVTEQWESTQGRRETVVDRNSRDGRALGEAVPVTEGLQARC